MNDEKNPVVITEEDYRLLKPFADRFRNAQDDMTLAHEINRAVVVKKEAFPPNTVRLSSQVSVLDQETNRTMDFAIVMPEHADMRKNKISVLTPMGTALLGFRKGEEVTWKVPAGIKRFRILDVRNNSVS